MGASRVTCNHDYFYRIIGYYYVGESSLYFRYDAPATIQVEFVDGREKRFLCEHYSKYEMQNIVDEWQYKCHMEFMQTHNLEKPDEE